MRLTPLYLQIKYDNEKEFNDDVKRKFDQKKCQSVGYGLPNSHCQTDDSAQYGHSEHLNHLQNELQPYRLHRQKCLADHLSDFHTCSDDLRSVVDVVNNEAANTLQSGPNVREEGEPTAHVRPMVCHLDRRAELRVVR